MVRGYLCPVCGNVVTERKDGRIPFHKGNVRVLVGSGRLSCRASEMTLSEADRFLELKAEGHGDIRAKVLMGLLPDPRKRNDVQSNTETDSETKDESA